jgi:hypothetical protein
MPVFEETADERRDLRILPSRALPLPRLTPETSSTDGEREVVVVGVSVQKSNSNDVILTVYLRPDQVVSFSHSYLPDMESQDLHYFV